MEENIRTLDKKAIKELSKHFIDLGENLKKVETYKEYFNIISNYDNIEEYIKKYDN